MQDRPSARELLDAVSAFLKEEVIDGLEGRKRFHALVAANVCKIVGREIDLGPSQLVRDAAGLWALLDRDGEPPTAPGEYEIRALNEELCGLIREGKGDTGPWRRALLAHLKAHVEDKLRVANPKLLAG